MEEVQEQIQVRLRKARGAAGWGGARAGSGPKPKLDKKLSALMASIDFRDLPQAGASNH
jgi:hypothetical protein